MTDQHDHDGPDAALRADIRRLGALLGQTLARQEGRPLLDLVEEVRAPGPLRRRGRRRSGSAALDVTTGTKLARAFSTYFHLANITEQVHRARELRRRRAVRGRLAGPGGRADRRARACRPSEIAAAARRLAVRPVFTAHPTEAARRSILTKLRAIADELDAETADAILYGASDERPGRPAPGRAARPACGRPTSCGWTGPTRPTRPATPSTTCATCTPSAAPQVLDDLADDAAQRLGVETSPTARPLTFGTWIGGDRDGNPYRHPGGDPGRAAHPARARHRGHRGGDGRPDQRGLRLPPAARGVPGPLRQPRRRPGRAARGRRPGSAGSTPRSRTGSRPAASRRSSPTPGERLRHGHPARARAATTSAPPSCSPTWS